MTMLELRSDDRDRDRSGNSLLPLPLSIDLEALRDLARRARTHDPAFNDLTLFRTPTDAELEQLRVSIDQLADVASSETEHLSTLVQEVEHPFLDDLTAVVRAELEMQRDRLSELRARRASTWELGVAAASTLSRVAKAAAVIENACCDLQGLEPRLSPQAGLETALEIRRAYARFWDSIPDEQPEGAAEIERRLRSAATSIARLVGRHVFLDLRCTDRRLLIDLQRRIRLWLSAEEKPEKGVCLWQDLVTFKSLLREINRRAELVEHDVRLLPELQALLAATNVDARPLLDDAYLRERIRRLLGRDSTLDRLIVCPEGTRGSELLQALCELEVEILGATFSERRRSTGESALTELERRG